MPLEGWKCLECGVVYAPFVKECRCSVKIKSNEEQVGCLHDYPGPYVACTKCGLMMVSNWDFKSSIDRADQSPCHHVWSEQGRAGRYCTKCMMQEVLWERPGNTTRIRHTKCGGENG